MTGLAGYACPSDCTDIRKTKLLTAFLRILGASRARGCMCGRRRDRCSRLLFDFAPKLPHSWRVLSGTHPLPAPGWVRKGAFSHTRRPFHFQHPRSASDPRSCGRPDPRRWRRARSRGDRASMERRSWLGAIIANLGTPWRSTRYIAIAERGAKNPPGRPDSFPRAAQWTRSGLPAVGGAGSPVPNSGRDYSMQSCTTAGRGTTSKWPAQLGSARSLIWSG